jgi:hypothetical protein
MKVLKLGSVMAMAAIMAACEQSDGGLSVNSVTGTVSLSDFYADDAPTCKVDALGSDDRYSGITLDGDTLSIINERYESTDGTCSGNKTDSSDQVYTLVNNGSMDVGWDGTPPNKADGSGAIASTVSASKYSYTVVQDESGTYTVGDVLKDIWFIDDSDSANVYSDYYGSQSGGTSSDGYPLLLDPSASNT